MRIHIQRIVGIGDARTLTDRNTYGIRIEDFTEIDSNYKINIRLIVR